MGDKIRVNLSFGEYDIPYSPRLERVDRDTVTMLATVTRSGVEPQQLVMNVQENQDRGFSDLPT